MANQSARVREAASLARGAFSSHNGNGIARSSGWAPLNGPTVCFGLYEIATTSTRDWETCALGRSCLGGGVIKARRIPRPKSELVEIVAIRGNGGPGRELKLGSGGDWNGNSVSRDFARMAGLECGAAWPSAEAKTLFQSLEI